MGCAVPMVWVVLEQSARGEAWPGCGRQVSEVVGMIRAAWKAGVRLRRGQAVRNGEVIEAV